MLYPLAGLSPEIDQAHLAQVPPTLEPPALHHPQGANAPRAKVSVAPAPSASAQPRWQSPPPQVPLWRVGSRGQGVTVLQRWLHRRGHYSGAIDGIYGPLTAAAVGQFQQAGGLPVDGVVGPATWAQLQARGMAIPLAQANAPALAPAVPAFTPPLPQVSFHPIAVTPATNGRPALWVSVLTVVALAGGGWGLSQGMKSGLGQASLPAPNQSIHRPEPIYPWILATPEADPAEADLSTPPLATASPTAPNPPASAAAGAAQAPPPPARPWAEAATPPCLEDFLYDLNDPKSLSRLLAQFSPDQVPLALNISNSAALVTRLGTLPSKNSRTGQPYTYSLIDDMGGCFRMRQNELWATQTASEWLQEDVPYVLTIRRRDHQGRTREKPFAITLNNYELRLAS